MATHAEQTDQKELVQPEGMTVLPDEDFDWLLEMLDEPDEPMPKIAEAAARHRGRPAFRRL